MDALVGVWVTSFVGAGAFSAAGFFAGQRRAKPALPPKPSATASPQEVATPNVSFAPAAAAPSTPAGATASAVTIPPPLEAPGLRIDLALADLEATKSELNEALDRERAAIERAQVAEAGRLEIEKQLEAVKADLRQEVASRATASARAEELGDRLATASEEAASLRHRVAQLDKERKQLREALQGRVKALTTSEWHRRRELEEAEEMRVKLKDVRDKLERSSLPPERAVSSPPPRGASSNRPEADLRAEIERLRSENASLRERALGSLPPKRSSRDSVPDVDLERYREVMARVGQVAGMHAAIIADELGSLLVGSGEHAESLAAFGAYIRDASARTERLLPLDAVEEVDIRDRTGTHLCTRVITRLPSELSLVMLGAGPATIVAAKRIADEGLRRR